MEDILSDVKIPRAQVIMLTYTRRIKIFLRADIDKMRYLADRNPG
jgi:hypothetical protein